MYEVMVCPRCGEEYWPKGRWQHEPRVGGEYFPWCVDMAVDNGPVDTGLVADVDRKAYQREWLRRKRAEAKVSPDVSPQAFEASREA